MTDEEVVEFIGSQIRTFVDCRDLSMFVVDKSLCFRAEVDINKPL